MKKLSLMAMVALAAMLLAVFAPAVSAAQPPVDTTTLYVATIGWGPRRADPVRAYDTGSGELLFNCYDTLIVMDHEKHWKFLPSLATNVPNPVEIELPLENTTVVNPEHPYCSYWKTVPDDGFKYHIMTDKALTVLNTITIAKQNPDGSVVEMRSWTIKKVEVVDSTIKLTLYRVVYDFILRTDPVIKFYDYTGAEVGTFGIDDVVYSFKRGLVQDQYGSPMWMFYKPFFDEMNSDAWDTGDPEDAWELSYLIDKAIEIISTDPPTVRFNLAFGFPDDAYKQIMSQTWASILDKDWCIGKGCWNGDLFSDANTNGYPDWFEAPPTGWRHISVSPIQAITPANYAGSGPYRVTVASSTLNKVVFERNVNYWKGWPAEGCGGYLERVVIDYIADWAARRDAFIACDYDVCAVPRAFMADLVEPDVPPGDPLYDPYTNYVDVPIKTIKNIPALTLDAMHYTFTINPVSEYVGTGSLKDGGGIPLDFFNNTHVRRAWNYAFHGANYIRDAYYGEALFRKNPLVYGLSPDYYLPDSVLPPYYESLQKAMEELQQAHFLVDGVDKTVWETGFYLKIAYNSGNDQRRIACQMISTFFSSLSTYNGRTGPPFTVEVIELSWPDILDKFENFELPTWIIGWLADFAHADNWMRPYMHSFGDFSYFQNYTSWNGWTTPGPKTGMDKDTLIDLALKTTNDTLKRICYEDLQWIYSLDAPSLPLAQAMGRRWCKYWVKGWYYNYLYPSQFYYHLWKHDTCWFDITGATPGVYDDATNARDVTYLILHFGARPPAPGYEDPKWVGTYGWGGVDPYGDRVCNARDITWTILHFGHRPPGKP
ncbi:MAG: ABC transporter substrate-binding protein [Candidatus Bathyarchaeia archaeon]